MNKLVLVLLCFLVANTAFSQNKPLLQKKQRLSSNASTNRIDSDSLSDRGSKPTLKNENAKIQDYLIITRENDTIQVDTTLSIYKDYKFNYLRKDDFEILPFKLQKSTQSHW